jgi:hypothetical protein
MRDEKHCQIQIFLQLQQQIHDFALRGDIEGGNRFVGDDEFRFRWPERRAMPYALALSARKLRGESVDT